MQSQLYRYTAIGNDTGAAANQSTICAMLVDWPSNNDNMLLLGALSSYHVSSVEMLGLSGM